MLTDFLARPLIIWRLEDPSQAPHCFVPESFAQLDNVAPMYLRIEEGVPGAEHYTALLPHVPGAPEEPPRPPKRAKQQEQAAAAAVAEQPDEEMPERTPAQKRGLQGWEAIGDWGKYGLTREEYRLVLDIIAEHTPMRAMDQLHAQVPNFEQAGINLQWLKHLKNADRQASAEESFEQQLKVLQHLQDGMLNQDALQAACPGVGCRFIAAARGQRCSETEEHWQQEFAQRFSTLKDVISGRTWTGSRPSQLVAMLLQVLCHWHLDPTGSVRRRLKQMGFTSSRVSQLLAETEQHPPRSLAEAAKGSGPENWM